MNPDQKSILPRPHHHVVVRHAVRIEGSDVFCWNCENKFGYLSNGNLVKPTSIMTNRTTFRCAECKEKNEFNPQR